MYRKKYYSLLILFLIISAPLFGKGKILKFGNPQDIKSLNLPKSFSISGEKLPSGMSKTFTFSVDLKKEVSLGRVEGKFDLLEVKDLKTRGKQGHPRVPVKVFTFELPENSVILGVEIIKGKYVEIKNRLKIAPVPEPVKIGMKFPKKAIRLIPDKKVYSLNSLFPGKIVSYVSGKRKKKVVGAVYFYPVQYNPAEKKAYLIYSAQINLYYRINGDKEIESTSSFNPGGPECIIICLSLIHI